MPRCLPNEIGGGETLSRVVMTGAGCPRSGLLRFHVRAPLPRDIARPIHSRMKWRAQARAVVREGARDAAIPMTAGEAECRCPGCRYVAERLGRVLRAIAFFFRLRAIFSVANPYNFDKERLSATADAAVTGC